MASDSKDIELRISAKDYSKKTLGELVDTLRDLTEAQSKQLDAAKRGEASAKDLAKSYGELENVTKALISRYSLTKTFDAQAKALADTKVKTDAARKAQEEYKNSLAGTETVTKKQQVALDKLARAVERAERAQQKAEDRLNSTSAKLDKYGIAADKVGAAQSRIVSSVDTGNAALERQENAIETLDAQLRKLSDQRIFEQQSKDAAELVRASEYVRFWTDALNEKDKIEAQQRDVDLFRKQADDAAQLVKAAEYVRFWTDALDEQDRQRDTESFRKIGADAQKAALSIGKAADQIDSLTDANRTAGDSVRKLVEPNTVLLRTMGGLEESIRKAGAAQEQYAQEVKQSGKSTVNLREELKQLEQVQKSAVSIAALADRFQNTRTAAAQAAVEFRQARGEVLQLARAVQSADAPNDELVKSLREAEATMAAAERRYQSFAAASNKLKGDLVGAGVNVRNLAGEVSRLQGVAGNAIAANQRLSDSIGKVGQQGAKTANLLTLFTRGQRTTLSYAQRLRGELLALTTTYIGLYGAIEGVNSILDAVQQRAATNARLGVAFGQEDVGNQMAYVTEQAERLGIRLPDLAEQYSKVAIGAQAAGLSLDETRFVFESFAEVGKVFNLTKDELDGTFKAIEQIFSKGSVQAEELRGQLGDRLTGAFYEFSKALGITSGDLNDWLKQGQVTSDFMLLFANQFRNKVAGQLGQATKNTASEIARFDTAMYNLKLTVADSGFIESFTEAVRRLTVFLKSDDGKTFADNLGKAMASVANAFIFLLDNIETVKTVLGTLVGYAVLTQVAVLGGRVVALAKGFKAIAAASPAAAAAIKNVFAVAASGAAGYTIGDWLYKNVAMVQGGAQAMIGVFDYMWTAIKGSFDFFSVELPGVFEDTMARINNIIVKVVREIVQFVAGVAERFGFDDFAKKITGSVADLAEKKVIGFGKRTEQLRKDVEKDLAEIQKLIKDSFAAADAAIAAGNKAADQTRNNAATGPAAGGTASSGSSLSPEREKELRDRLEAMRNELSAEEKKALERQRNERLKFERQMAEELADIDDDLAAQKADTLEKRLDLIRLEYRELFADLDKLGGEEAVAGRAKVEELIRLRQQEAAPGIQEDLRDEKLDPVLKKEEEVNRLVQVRDAQIEAINAKVQAGILTELEGRRAISEIQNASAPAIQAGADATIAMAESIKDPALATQLELVAARMDQVKTGANEIPNRLISTQAVLEQWADGLANVAEAGLEAALSAGSLSEGFKGALQAFRQFAADFLKQIAQMILKQMLLNALQAATGGANFFSGLTAAPVAHTGGVIGRSALTKRLVDPSIFANASKFHTGGVVGLKSDEVPAILQKDEEVLSRDDPRNIMNGGAGAGSQQPVQVKVVNSFDSEGVVREALNTTSVQQAVLNIVRANKGVLA